MDPMLPQTVDPAACWHGLRARDARFDGRFFVGVTSTGIYCRPICPARTPRRENCRFFPSAAGAEVAGFRPCLRCRPELAPGHASVDAPARLAQAAAAAIEEGALDAGGLPALASRLGVTDRHLRRVFDAQFGVSPIDWALTQRLLLAKRLLTDTALPVTEVALASGFGSVRRFNDAFVRRYRLAPGDLRRQARGASPSGDDRRRDDAGAPPAVIDASAAAVLTFRLAYRPPLDFASVAAFLAQRAIAGVEAVEPGGRRGAPVYRRIVRVPGVPGVPGAQGARGADRIGWIEVTRPTGRAAARDVVEVRVDPALVGSIPAVLARVRRVFDLGCRPDEVAAVLGPLAEGHEGLRLPGAFDGFEIVVRAILGQQITVKHARTLAGRFAAAFGEPRPTPWPALAHAFPSAAAIADRDPAEIAALGLTGQRARTIVALARAIAHEGLRLEPDGDAAATVERLLDVPGIGDWTAQYLAMRALGWPDAFPAADVGVMKALGVKTPREALAAAEAWRPWRGYAVIHLWRRLAPLRIEE
ncbi:MAG: putative bifunctional transcriptional activator/DNA repair enzyme AlkA [Pseudomonadota bacterium]|jgi:AraC family transcriptional regulator of adaptative response / DNA-3-methyladenine glycosylase II